MGAIHGTWCGTIQRLGRQAGRQVGRLARRVVPATLGYGPGMQQPTNPAPLHGVISAGGTSYGYDAAGDRTNAGYASNLVSDSERRLVGWTNGATTGSAAYDGEGNRVAMQTITTSAPPPTPGRVTAKGPIGYTSTTATTDYVLGLEDVTGGVITKYIAAGGTLPSAVRVGSTLSYLAVDGLGSVTESLDTSGNVTAQQLYAPYGSVRYTVGTLPTTKGYAGQRQDVSSGLNDDAARYYDSGTEQFASADTVSDAGNGLNRLAYVGGNPETRTDPSGHMMTCGAECMGGGGGGGGGPAGGGNPGSGGDGGMTCNQAGCSAGGGQTGGNGTLSYVCGPDNSCDPPPSGCGTGCTGVSSPCNSVYTCTGIQPEAIGVGHHACSDPTACVYGNNPSSLFQFLSGVAHDADHLMLEGTTGIQWLLDQLGTFESAVLQAFSDAINWYEGQLAIGIGVVFVPVPFVGTLGVLAGGSALVQIIRLKSLEADFKDSFSHFEGELQDLQRVAPSAEIMVTSTDSSGQDYDWTTQSLRIAFVWTATAP